MFYVITSERGKCNSSYRYNHGEADSNSFDVSKYFHYLTFSVRQTAYLSFYVSEILAGCSGIIAVVFCGLTTKAFGATLINDSHLTEDFWHITEHLLNTTLFTLAGAIWGGIIDFGGSEDWIYLLILFASINVIRCVLVFVFFPITSNLGIGQSIKEAIFMSYAGLRGAVGIALALLLSAETVKYSASDEVSEEQRHHYQFFVDKLFGKDTSSSDMKHRESTQTNTPCSTYSRYGWWHRFPHFGH